MPIATLISRILGAANDPSRRGPQHDTMCADIMSMIDESPSGIRVIVSRERVGTGGEVLVVNDPAFGESFMITPAVCNVLDDDELIASFIVSEIILRRARALYDIFIYGPTATASGLLLIIMGYGYLTATLSFLGGPLSPVIFLLVFVSAYLPQIPLMRAWFLMRMNLTDHRVLEYFPAHRTSLERLVDANISPQCGRRSYARRLSAVTNDGSHSDETPTRTGDHPALKLHIRVSRRTQVVASIVMIIVSISTMVTANHAYAIQELQHITVDGRDRTFLLRLPPDYSPSRSYPLVIALHGGGGNAEAFERRTGLTEVARREGFIVCYPNGNGPLGYSFLTWNSGYCCGYALSQDIDDVRFIRELISHLKHGYSINQNRIYVTGLSNGGILTQLLAATLPGTFTAIAAIAGPIGGYANETADLWMPPTPSVPVPVLIIHGTADTHVPYNGGAGGFSTSGRIDLSVNETLAFWLGSNNCSGSHSRILGRNIEIDRYDGGSNQTEVILITIIGGLHVWPGELTDPHKVISASEIVWSFFRNHTDAEF